MHDVHAQQQRAYCGSPVWVIKSATHINQHTIQAYEALIVSIVAPCTWFLCCANFVSAVHYSKLLRLPKLHTNVVCAMYIHSDRIAAWTRIRSAYAARRQFLRNLYMLKRCALLLCALLP